MGDDRIKGTIGRVFRDRGFCFLKNDTGGFTFAHFSKFDIPEMAIETGRRVSFVVTQNRRDPSKTFAIEIKPDDEPGDVGKAINRAVDNRTELTDMRFMQKPVRFGT